MTEAPYSYTRPPQNPGGNDGQQQLTRFFDWIRSTGFVRGDERWFAGVCGAVAGRTGLDPLIVRGIAVVLAILGGPVLFAYAVGWALLPNVRGRIHAEQLFRGIFEPAMVGILALLVVTVVPLTRGVWWEGAPLWWGMPEWLATTLAVGWGIAVGVGIVWLVIFLIRRSPAPRTPSTERTSSYQSASSYRGASSYQGTPSYQSGAPFAAQDASPAFADTAAGTSAADAGSPAATAASADFDSSTASAVPPVPPPPAPAPGADAPPSARDAWQEQNRTWQEQNRQWKQEQKAWHANLQEWRRHRHLGAGFTAILLGLALASGAVAAAVFSAGIWSPGALIVGLAFTLGVLALGMIIAGIRGRDSGALGGFAFLAALALVITGIFPQGTQFSPFGSPTWSVSSSRSDQGYAVIAGRPTVDLSQLDDAGAGSGAATIDVWLGFGETELILPADSPVRVQSHAFIGATDYGDENFGAETRGGFFFQDSRTFNRDGTSIPEIRVWTFIGQVTIIESTR